jgi:hypothetical protein
MLTEDMLQAAGQAFMAEADSSGYSQGWLLAASSQCHLLRCIFGNPFRSVAIDPSWLTPNVVTLGQATYEDRAFDRMPTLGHTLEEAGCDNPDILTHCWSQTEHVRGCWAVDALLGKT